MSYLATFCHDLPRAGEVQAANACATGRNYLVTEISSKSSHDIIYFFEILDLQSQFLGGCLNLGFRGVQAKPLPAFLPAWGALVHKLYRCTGSRCIVFFCHAGLLPIWQVLGDLNLKIKYCHNDSVHESLLGVRAGLPLKVASTGHSLHTACYASRKTKGWGKCFSSMLWFNVWSPKNCPSSNQLNS